VAVSVFALLAGFGGPRAQAQSEEILYSFSGADGAYPDAGLIMDASGNLYGTTSHGGIGYGAVFELVNSSGTYSEKVLHNFTGYPDGTYPIAGLIMDASGNLYGTTSNGGTDGYGTVFELVNSSGTYSESVLYSFTNSSGDGATPTASLIMDKSGNLYGTTNGGGTNGYGTVFELVNSAGTYSEKVLYSFTGSPGDGANPIAGLILDASGNLYGTTVIGGTNGVGTVFELVNSSGTYSEKVLYSFTNFGGDGAYAYGGLIMDASGNLYGTTYSGGTNGAGTIFELANSSGTYSEKVLYSFTGVNGDGALPYAGLTMDTSGNLYGTTYEGGTNGYGTVFKLVNSPGAYSEKVLYSFTGSGDGDGANPYYASLSMDASGDLYGTTVNGGNAYGDGTVFELVNTTSLSAPAFTSQNATTFPESVAGSFTVTTSGSPTPALTESGTLPSGVTFTDNGNGTGSLAGTPASGTAGTYPITFTASNSVGSTTQSFTLTVNLGVAITSGSSTTFTVASAGSFTVTTVGTPTPALSESGSLPSGVTFVDNGDGTGTLSGTPASATTGNYPITFTASNSVSSATQNFTLTVNQGPAITSGSTTTFAVGTAGSFLVTATGTPTPALTENGTLPAGVTFVDNGNGTATLSGTPAAGSGGSYGLLITAANGVGTNATQSFTLTINQGLAITSGSMTTFTVGATGFFSVTTTGFPAPALTESGSLPSGVTFTDNGNGTATLSGTPATDSGGTYPLTITASNGGVDPNAIQSFTLVVNQGAAILTGNITTLTVGVAGSFTVSTTGVPVPALTETGALPGGVTFVDNGNGTGTLSGTQVAGSGGSYAITFTANNGVGTAAMQSFTLIVNQGPAITSSNTATFTEQVAGSFTVTTTGDPTPSLSETGSLPSGVTFVDNGNGTATLSGTPAAGTAGQYGFTIQASSGVLPNATQSFTLTVNPSQTASVITWAKPAPINYGEAIGSTELNATANVPGTFVYSPPAGTVLPVGTQTLSVAFTPTNTTLYTTATATVQLTVLGDVPYTIGGTVSGVATNNPVVLLDNGTNPKRLTTNGKFTLTRVLATGATYDVTVETPPTGETCTVTNGSGTVGTKNVTNVVVACIPGYSIGGTIYGLAQGQSLVLLDNGGDPLTVNGIYIGNIGFAFDTVLTEGQTYDVTVATQPINEICTVTLNTGHVTGNVSNIEVSCQPNKSSI
jgi:uncharacterized repeat protein (TIGR03803 family)